MGNCVQSSANQNVMFQNYAVKLLSAIDTEGNFTTETLMCYIKGESLLVMDVETSITILEVSIDGILYHPDARSIEIGDFGSVKIPDSIPRFQKRMEKRLTAKELSAISRQYSNILVRLPRD